MRKKNREGLIMNLFYLPAVALLLFFVVYPLLRGIHISFTNWNGYSQSYKYVGFRNYVKVFSDPNVGIALINTLIYGIGSTLLQNLLGLGFALLLNRGLRGSSLVRTVVYMPVMVSALVMGYIMYFLVQYSGGAINDIVMLFGNPPVDFLADGTRAVVIITLVNSLQFCGVSMVIYLAGLQNIPTMYYEAVALDGADGWGQFRHVTMPMLVPAVNSAVVLNLIGGLKLYDVIKALTNGGPSFRSHSLSTLITYNYFSAQKAGYSAVIGILTFVLVMVVSNIAMLYFDRKEVYQ